MERTLEQVIMDIAAHNWSSFVDKEEEAAAIAEAVRGWMREQNEGLRGVIFDLLLEELPINEVTITSSKYAEGCVDAILSVIPPRRVQSAPDRSRIKELEAELAEEQSTRNLLSDENRALRVRLEEVTAFLRLDTSGEESWNALADKAAKYDELRAKFPFLPGAVVWILQDGVIQRATVWRIGERVARVLLDEIAIDVDPSRLHPTADACRNAIKVEE